MSNKSKKDTPHQEGELPKEDFSTEEAEAQVSGGSADSTSADHRNGDDNENNAETETSNDETIKDEYLYLRAEFENFKRQAIKERSDLVKFGNERLIVELLNVLDIFDSALQTDITPESIESFKKGMEMTASELRSLLGRYGVTCIDPSGQPFDPSLHEALSSEPTASVEPGHISQVFKKAYKLHDRVIRPAQVVVAKEPEQDS